MSEIQLIVVIFTGLAHHCDVDLMKRKIRDHNMGVWGYSKVSMKILERETNVVLQETETTYNTGNVGFGQPKSRNLHPRQRIVSRSFTKYHDLLVNGTTFRPIKETSS